FAQEWHGCIVHLRPEPLDVAGILADQEWAEQLGDVLGLIAPGPTDADESVVGADLERSKRARLRSERVVPVRLKRNDLDRRDLHSFRSSFQNKANHVGTEGEIR